MKKYMYAFVFVTVLCLSSVIYADAPDLDPGKFAEAIEAFAV